MTGTAPDAEYGTPDEESPELTEEFFLWSVTPKDFGGDFMRMHDFLRERTAFLRGVEAAGIEKSALLSFDPRKPGFVERATDALESALALAKAEITADKVKHAAE